METVAGEKIPACLKMILTLTGFESKLSIATINDKKLDEIEFFVNSKSIDIASQLSCCSAEQYQSQTKFMLLPGHRAAILEIVDCLQRKQKRKRLKKSMTAQMPIVETVTEGNVDVEQIEEIEIVPDINLDSKTMELKTAFTEKFKVRLHQ